MAMPAKPADAAVSAVWKRWASRVISWIRTFARIRGIRWSGTSNSCDVYYTARNGREYVCQIRNFNYRLLLLR